MNNFRVVTPYYYDNRVYCKERWIGKTLHEIMIGEFRSHPKQEHERAIREGRAFVTRNGERLDQEEPLKNKDLFHYCSHWHEPPVTAAKVKILHQDENLVVVDKPSGIPVHQTGKYRYNTVLEIMQNEVGVKLMACHRLDKLTSGVLVLSNSSAWTSSFAMKMKAGRLQKEYVAKVKGEFPESTSCHQKLYDIDGKLSIDAFKKVYSKGGKDAHTDFTRINYDGIHSIVKCFPHTGRTHQIRKHLAILGYPIANDILYNSIEFKQLADAIEEGDFDQEYADFMALSVNRRQSQTTGKVCEECGTDIFHPPAQLSLWLHSYRYQDLDGAWDFFAPDLPF